MEVSCKEDFGGKGTRQARYSSHCIRQSVNRFGGSKVSLVMQAQYIRCNDLDWSLREFTYMMGYYGGSINTTSIICTRTTVCVPYAEMSLPLPILRDLQGDCVEQTVQAR